MKWIIASDIHGCSSSVKRLIEIYEKEKAERFLFLGDILYHGPRNSLPGEYDTFEVTQLLNQYAAQIYCVRGNCDAEVDQQVLEFPIVADYMQLPIEDKVFFATHGHHIGPSNLPPIGSADYLLCGHTHIPACEKIGDIMYLNPGSISIPKGGSEKSFILLDGKKLQWRHLDDNKTYKEITI